MDPINYLQLFIADQAPEEMIIEMLEKACAEYRITGNYDAIKPAVALVVAKDNIKMSGGIDNMIKKYEEFKSIRNVMSHLENES